MAYGYPYQPGGLPNYFNTNYAPPAPQSMQQSPQPATNVTWIYVSGMSGAREQIVQPGQTAWMMDNNDPVIYVKSVDQMGSANLKAFKLDEISPGANDLNAVNERLTRLEAALSGLVNDLGGGAKHEPVGADCGQAGGK